jgi:hypothetical protein
MDMSNRECRALGKENSGDGLQAIFRHLPPEVRTNPYVERAVIVLQALSIEERLRQVKASNNPPAKPGAFICEPLKAAMRGR